MKADTQPASVIGDGLSATTAKSNDSALIAGQGVGWSRPYLCWVTFVLLCANTLNYADRKLLSVLAEAVKVDLGLTDAQIGFLYGTSFVVTNAIMGIMLSRVADKWLRNIVMSVGVLFWSMMTAISGFTTNFTHLAAARFGIGVGEAAIGPASHSLLADVVPSRFRAMAFAVYGLGAFLGMALAFSVGGWIVQNWPAQCSTWGLCSIRNWQVAFLLFGLPGVVVAALIATVREPEAHGIRARRQDARPLSEVRREFIFIIPPFSFFAMARIGGGKGLARNIAMAVGLAVAATGLSIMTDNPAQWGFVAIAVYCLLSWIQSLILREPRMHQLTSGSTAFVTLLLGVTLFVMITTAVSFWKIPLAMRNLGMSAQEAGAQLAATLTIGSFVGILGGGVLVDLGRKRVRGAAIYLLIAGLIISGLGVYVMVTTSDIPVFIMAAALTSAATAIWSAGVPALVQEMILPEMRARTSALFQTTVLTVSLAIGPFLAGHLGDATGSIGTGLALLYLLAPVAAVLMVISIYRLPEAFARRDALAAAPA